MKKNFNFKYNEKTANKRGIWLSVTLLGFSPLVNHFLGQYPAAILFLLGLGLACYFLYDGWPAFLAANPELAKKYNDAISDIKNRGNKN